MAVGLIAAGLVAVLCYRRFRSNTLDDRPAAPETGAVAGEIQPRPM
jgi:hypothetical protein